MRGRRSPRLLEVPSKLTFDWVIDSPASMVIVHANAATHANASRVAREAGPRIFEALQRRVKSIVAESVKLSVALPRGVDTEAKALRATRDGNGTTKALEVWERLTALIADWVRAFDLVNAMQNCGWVPGPGHAWDRTGALVFQRYQKPLSLPPGYWDKTPPQLRLGVAQASGSGPRLYGWDDAVSRFEKWDRLQHNYQPMAVTQVIGGYGNVIAEDRGPETPAPFKPAAVS